ncbi:MULTISPECIES: SDR family oxidoreductase [unclassified Arthrobacter]|uniref:SDR family oxidoreductase n=1 Tax=unclassified Arthrobacter TaxID=235627 RepID=UPI001C6125A0|nr:MULTISPECIES: SDR family oxidoreductase [unclassified Arthrobacter]
MNRLKGKTAVVTAAGQGIGRRTAEMFVAEGAEVWALDLNAELLADLEGQDGLNAVGLNVLDRNALSELATRTGPVDVLFNGVGMVHVGDIMNCTDDEFEAALRVNVISMFGVIKAFLPGMLESGNGSIINMSSVQSSVRGFPQRFAYATSKAAVIGLTKSVAADYANQGIRCNAICPSAVDTPSMRQRIDAMPDPAQAMADFSARQPVGRMGTPEDIASLAVYLASEESSYMTGSTVIIDGGAVN